VTSNPYEKYVLLLVEDDHHTRAPVKSLLLRIDTILKPGAA
jgi:hypothetical protein